MALRQIRLRLGNRSAKNTQTIVCADTSDYMPFVENYGYSFEPVARVKLRKDFLESEQYKYYMKNHDISADKLRSAFKY